MTKYHKYSNPCKDLFLVGLENAPVNRKIEVKANDSATYSLQIFKFKFVCLFLYFHLFNIFKKLKNIILENVKTDIVAFSVFLLKKPNPLF